MNDITEAGELSRVSISVEDLFGPWLKHPDATIERRQNAERLLEKVNALLEHAQAQGLELPVNAKTETLVSGDTLGGFRPQSCSIGAPQSAHKQGRAVDVYDPIGELDTWLNDTLLERFGLYREHPSATHGWSHLTDRAPPSGHRTFFP
jgi:hypothetical protein